MRAGDNCSLWTLRGGTKGHFLWTLQTPRHRRRLLSRPRWRAAGCAHPSRAPDPSRASRAAGPAHSQVRGRDKEDLPPHTHLLGHGWSPIANSSKLSDSDFVGTGVRAACEGDQPLQPRAFTEDSRMLRKCSRKHVFVTSILGCGLLWTGGLRQEPRHLRLPLSEQSQSAAPSAGRLLASGGLSDLK